MTENSDIRVAEAQLREADAQLRIAGAALFPTLDFSATGTRSRRSVSSSGTGNSNFSFASSGRDSNTFSPTLTASYTLDPWNENGAGVEAASQTALAQQFNRDNVRLSVEASVASTYFQLQSFNDRITIAMQNRDVAQGLLNAIQARVAVGTASDLDIAQQQTVLAQTEAALPPLREQQLQTANALAVLVGRTPEAIEFQNNGLQALKIPEVGPGLPSQLLTRRPDIAQSEAELASANANVAVARAALLPSITLTAEGGYQSSKLENLISPASLLWSLSAGLTQPIFEGGKLRGQLELQRATERATLESYRKVVLTAFEDVDNGLAGVAETSRQEAAEDEVVADARQSYKIASGQFEAGTVDLTSILTSEQTLFQDEDSLVQIRLSHLQAVVTLFEALGGGWSHAAS